MNIILNLICVETLNTYLYTFYDLRYQIVCGKPKVNAKQILIHLNIQYVIVKKIHIFLCVLKCTCFFGKDEITAKQYEN